MNSKLLNLVGGAVIGAIVITCGTIYGGLNSPAPNEEIGRYTMQATDFGVYVLDTREGLLTYFWSDTCDEAYDVKYEMALGIGRKIAKPVIGVFGGVPDDSVFKPVRQNLLDIVRRTE